MTPRDRGDADAKDRKRYDALSVTGLADAVLDFRETIRPGADGNLLTSPFSDGTRRRESKKDLLAKLPRIPIHVPTDTEVDALLVTADDEDQDVRIIETLGEGGMGRVYAAKQQSLGREVAVKTLRAKHPDDTMIETIVAEARVTGRLDHPHVIPVHQLGLDDAGRPVIVMKRVAGVSWSSLLERKTHPAWKKLVTLPKDRLEAHLRILIAVADALSFAHSRGYLHRDVKPQNVMVGEFGEVYLADWGVAHQLDGGSNRSQGLVGTPCYLAPEMLDDAMELGPHTDVYLLGATLHTVLTGEARHDGAGLIDVLKAAHASLPATYGPGVPDELAALCNRATARDPAERPQSALEFRRAIEAFLTHRTSFTLSAAADERLFELERRREEGAEIGELVRLVTESRFGHLLAKREWEENPRARTGLRRCLELAISLELARENPEAARSLLGELEQPPEPLVHALYDLETRTSRRSVAEAKLARIEQDNDMEITARIRRRIMFGLIAFAAVSGAFIAWYELENGLWGRLPAMMLVYINVVAFTLASALAFFARKKLFQNAINARLTVLFLGVLVVEGLFRLNCALLGMPSHAILSADLVILGTATAATGLFVARPWIGASFFAFLGSVAAVLAPKLAEVIFVIASCAMFMWTGLVYKPFRSKWNPLMWLPRSKHEDE